MFVIVFYVDVHNTKVLMILEPIVPVEQEFVEPFTPTLPGVKEYVALAVQRAAKNRMS